MQAAGPVTVSTVVEPDKQAAALSMWTRSNISRVRALEMPVDTGVGGVAVDALDGAGLTGPVRMKPAGKAAANADQVARAAYARDWQNLEAELATEVPAAIPAGTSSVYTYYDLRREHERRFLANLSSPVGWQAHLYYPKRRCLVFGNGDKRQ